ncbi:Axonemal dynein light chain [Trinorchestia longiramus]|nr:Axonemal dynein light chain [Trinorchestia longiramus]
MSENRQASLVKYDTPLLVTTKKKEPGISKATQADHMLPSDMSESSVTSAPGMTGRVPAGGALGTFQTDPQPALPALAQLKHMETEEVLKLILPPRQWEQDGQLWVQSVSTTPATSVEVQQLQEQLDLRLQQLAAYENGICPVRRELYTQCFDELIRQVTINCSERGLLLYRVRHQLGAALHAYQRLYTSACAYGVRKALMAEEQKVRLSTSCEEKRQQSRLLHQKAEQLKAEIEQLQQEEKQARQEENERHQEATQTQHATIQILKLLEQRFLLENTDDSSSLNSVSVNKTIEIESKNSDDASQKAILNNGSAKPCCSSEHLSRLICSVNFTLEANALILSEVLSSTNQTSYILQHPEFCPTRLQHQTSEGAGSSTSPGDVSTNTSSSQGIAVGVSMLTQSADGKVLLTRRARHMRTFPGVWVPPGGHVEVGESLVAAGARELLEETGVALQPDQPVQVLGMWESVYPPVLGLGAPQRQHLIVYLCATMSLPAHALRLQLQAKEVEAGVWLSAEQVAVVVHGPESSTVLPSTIPGIILNGLGESVPGEVDISKFGQRPVAGASDFSRLSTGSKYALSLWLEQQQTHRGCSPYPPHASL